MPAERHCFCGNPAKARARYCSDECGATARLAAVDEPCDPRELGPATVPNLSDVERRHRLIAQYLAADWKPHEIGTLLDMHPDSVSRIGVHTLGIRLVRKRDGRRGAGILKAEGT